MTHETLKNKNTQVLFTTKKDKNRKIKNLQLFNIRYIVWLRKLKQ